MKKSLTLALLLLGALLFGLTRPGEAGSRPARLQDGPVHLLPFGLMEAVRETGHAVPMQVQAYHSGDEPVSLERLEVRNVNGELLDAADLHGERLVGDGGELFTVHLMLEQMDPDLSHRHTHRLFIPLDEHVPLEPEAEARLYERVKHATARLREGGAHQIRNLGFTVDLAALFPAGAEPGDEAVFDVTLRYRDAAGEERTAALSGQRIELLAPHLPPPAAWWERRGIARGGGAWMRGDLHVHNCRDQALLGCPDCPAESFNLTGSFTNADLVPQYQALGFDFFSTTTHSYCINSDAEFDDVFNESQALDQPDFQVLCGTELTTEEQGPQTGTDINDSVCFLGGEFFSEGIAHYGGHGITSRKEGGDEGFLDNCDEPIHSQGVNVDAVNAEGGFAIANHPGGDTISLNSVAQFEGMESNGARGCEIWNGDGRQADVVHRSWWPARLNEGRLTYPFSGSDTHDAAFDFGATHVWLEGSLSDASLIDALQSGNHYLSNGPFLSIELFDSRGNMLGMGEVAQVPAHILPNNYPVSVEVFYNTAASSTINVFVGSVGGSEALAASFPAVNGQGSVVANVTVPTGGHSWYRAEIVRDDGTRAAYTSTSFIVLR